MSVSLAVGDIRRIAHGPMRKLFIGQFLNALGNGLTLALLIVYLSKVRDIPLGVATALLAWQAVLALLMSPISGTLVDRFGPRPILMGSVLVTAVGIFAYGHVDDRRRGVRRDDRGRRRPAPGSGGPPRRSRHASWPRPTGAPRSASASCCSTWAWASVA